MMIYVYMHVNFYVLLQWKSAAKSR